MQAVPLGKLCDGRPVGGTWPAEIVSGQATVSIFRQVNALAGKHCAIMLHSDMAGQQARL